MISRKNCNNICKICILLEAILNARQKRRKKKEETDSEFYHETITSLQIMFLKSCNVVTKCWNKVASVLRRFCPASNYMFKVNSRNTRTKREICSKLTIKTPERPQWRYSGAFIVNFEHISHLVLVFLLSALSRYMPTGCLWTRTKTEFCKTLL